MEDRTPESTTTPAEPETLKNTRECLRHLFEDAPLGCQSLDPDGRILMVNRAWLELLGYARDEVAGRPFSDFLAPGGADVFHRRFPVFKSEGRIRGLEIDMVRKDRRTITVSLDGTIARDRDGSVSQAHCILEDITERRTAEEEKALLATMLNAAPASITVHDFDGKLLYYNERTLEMYGYSREEFIALDPHRCVAPGGPAHIAARLGEARKKGEALFELRHPRKDRPDLPLLVYAKPVRWNGREALLSIAIDITEKKRAEEALALMDAKFRGLVNNAGSGVAILDLEGRFTFVNRALCELAGYSEPELLGKNFSDLLHPDDLGRIMDLFLRARSEPELVAHIEFRAVRKDGSVRHCYSSPTAQIVNGEVTGFEALVFDITGRKKAESDLVERNRAMAAASALAAELAAIPPGKDIRHSIVGRFREFTGASAAWFCDFDPAANELAVADMDLEPRLAREAEKLLGASPSSLRVPLTAEMHEEILRSAIGRRSTLHEVSFGAVPEQAASAIQSLLGADRFIGIAFVLEGALFGTLVLALGAAAPEPPEDALVMMARMAAISLRRRKSEKALRESEERFRTAFEQGPLGMAVTNMEYRFLGTNAMFCRILGYGPDELSRLTFRDITHKDHLSQDNEGIRLLDAGAIPVYKTEKRYIRKDKSEVWGRLTVSLLHDADGRAIHHLVMLEDITERRRLEAAITESEERYRSLVENTNEGILLTAPDGRVFSANPAACRMLGRNEEEICNLGRYGVVDPDDPLLRPALEERARTGKFKGELALVRGDGTRFPAEVSSTVFEIPGGEKRTVMLIGDISERKKTESDLVRLSAAVRLAREIIVITDPEGRVTFANEAAAAALSPGPGGIIGAPFLDLLAPEDREKGRLVLEEASRKGALSGVELGMRSRNGETTPVELSAAALGGSGPAPSGIVTISRDVTDKRRTERELRSRLMSYELEDGNVYLVKEATPAMSTEAFRDLLKAGYRGSVLSRTPPGRFKPEPGRPVDYRWMAEKGDGSSLTPRLADIERWIEGFPQNRALLLDRLDYLISKNGFRGTLHFVHRLGELAFLMGHIVIVSIDPATISERDLRALEKEARQVVPRARPELPRDELEVLRFVFEQGIAGARPTLTGIGAELGLSKPTARKKVRALVRRGYLAMSLSGRTKVLELTEQGRRLFSG